MYAYQKYLFAINFFVTYCWSAGFREPATMRWCVRSSTKWESGHSSKAAPGRRLFRQFLVWEVLGQFNWGSQSRTDKERGRDRKDESVLSAEAASQHRQSYSGLGSENTLQMGGDGGLGAQLWWKGACDTWRLCQWTAHMARLSQHKEVQGTRGQKSVLPPCYAAAKCALTLSWGSLAVVNTGATEAFKEK